MKKCKQCNEQITSKNAKIFCSRSCSTKHKNIHTHSTKGKGKGKPLCQTDNCDNIVNSYGHKFCHECNTNNTHRLYQKNPTKKVLVDTYAKTNHRSSAYSYIRWHARAVVLKGVKSLCAFCKYDKHTEVCHIKGISSFEDSSTLAEMNDPNNLICMCPNCHWEFDHGLLTM